MGTTIRPELSEKNKYWIEKHRYYELKHFCLQYPTWKKAYLALDGLSRRPTELAIFSNVHSDPTFRCVLAREFYFDRMKMVEQTAIATDADLYWEQARFELKKPFDHEQELAEKSARLAELNVLLNTGGKDGEDVGDVEPEADQDEREPAKTAMAR